MAQQARVVLEGSLSHTVRLPGTSTELKLKKGQPQLTADPTLIAYCRARPQLFRVSTVDGPAPAKKPAAASKPAARGRSGGKSGKSGKRGKKDKVSDED